MQAAARLARDGHQSLANSVKSYLDETSVEVERLRAELEPTREVARNDLVSAAIEGATFSRMYAEGVDPEKAVNMAHELADMWVEARER
jgi:hypothetical protein